MTDWLPLLQSIWLDHAPVLLLLALLLLYPVGYPVAFVLGALALVFGWVGIQSGLIAHGRFDTVSSDLFNDLMLDPALLCLPLLILLAEFMVATGQMERASRAIKGFFDPGWLTIDKARDEKRKSEIRVKAHKEETPGRRSLFMTMFTPASLLLIILARIFELSPEAMTFALLVPAGLLVSIYLINWMLDLWTERHRARLLDEAGLVIPVAGKGGARPIPGRLWRFMRLTFFALPPTLLVVLALVLLFYLKMALFASFAVLAVAILIVTLLQGKLRPSQLVRASYRALVATGNLAAMMLAAYCFHVVFSSLGGAHLITQSTELLSSLGPETRSWWLLFLTLFALVGLGFFFDWILLSFIALPLLRPFFASLDFTALLTPLWTEAAHDKAQTVAESMPTTMRPPGQLLSMLDLAPPSRIWLASMVWLALLTSVVTYTRQNGELTARRRGLVLAKGDEAHISMTLFLILQLIGLTLVLIMPQAVFWLPALLIG
ncbi:hypothetical protein [uncultured Cohaesibacter sp.]|uniref:hypothetical protein n=1 Tax=uncultured Cohaesibacter sp. TaxID=1002546 RepID=UPI0029C9533A|nr:hypothetical protein [uncultured Cohaesibacter sp.]